MSPAEFLARYQATEQRVTGLPDVMALVGGLREIGMPVWDWRLERSYGDPQPQAHLAGHLVPPYTDNRREAMGLVADRWADGVDLVERSGWLVRDADCVMRLASSPVFVGGAPRRVWEAEWRLVLQSA